MQLDYAMTDTQQELFFDAEAKIKIVPKGRRFGLTQGAAYWFIDSAITNAKYQLEEYYLWGDVSYGNIDRYFERYFLPLLKANNIRHNYNRQNRKLSFSCSPTVIDFRSAEHPSSWEGFGYKKTFLNEAGIILKNVYIWDNCIRIMMLDYPDAEMIIGGTPKGAGGRYEDLWVKSQSGEFPHMWGKTYTSYDNPILRVEDINLLLEDIPSGVAPQEIFGKFIKPADTLIDRAWIKYAEPPENCIFKMYVDLAISKKTTADYTAIAVIGRDSDGNIYIADIFRDRLSFKETCKVVTEYAAKWGISDPGIESIAYQEAVAEELERETNLNIQRVFPNKDKVTRFYPVAARMERGLVYLSGNLPGYFMKELLEFPGSENDDMIDAVSGAYDLHFNPTEYHVWGGLN